MKFAIIDTLTNRVHVTSYSESVITEIFESGYKTKWGKFKVAKINV